MSPWLVLVESLHPKPPEPKKRGNPGLHKMQRDKKQEARRLVLEAIVELGGAATADSITRLTGFSYKYAYAVCASLWKEGKLTSYMLHDGKARRKYWKMI